MPDDRTPEPTPDARPDVPLAHHRPRVGPHRVHRLRWATDTHCDAASAHRRARTLDRRDRVRRRHRGDEHPARARLHPARHLLRVAPARHSRRVGRRGLLHRPGPRPHHRPGCGLPGLEPAHLDQGRGPGRRCGRGGSRPQRRARVGAGELAPGRRRPGPSGALGGLRRRRRRRRRDRRHVSRPRAAGVRAGGAGRHRWHAAGRAGRTRSSSRHSAWWRREAWARCRGWR